MAGVKAVEGGTLQASGCFDPANQRTKHVIVVSTIALAALALFSYALLSHFTPHLLGHLAMSPHVIFASMALSGVAAVALPILHGIIPSSRLTVVPDNNPVVPRLSPSSSTGSLTAPETVESEEETDPIDELRSCDLLKKPLNEIYDQLLEDQAQVSNILFERLYLIYPYIFPQATQVNDTPGNLFEFWRLRGDDLLARIQTPENWMLKAFFPFISSIQLGQAIESKLVDKLEQSLFPNSMPIPKEFTFKRFGVLPENIVSANNIRYFSASFLRCLSYRQLNALPWDLICQDREFLNNIFDVEDEESREWTENMLKGLTQTNLLRIRPYLNAPAIPTIQLNLEQFAFDPQSSDEQSLAITGFTLADLKARLEICGNSIFSVPSSTPWPRVVKSIELMLCPQETLLEKPLTDIHALLLEDQAVVSSILWNRLIRLLSDAPQANFIDFTPRNLKEFWGMPGDNLLARIQAGVPEAQMLKALFPFISHIQLGQAIESQHVDKVENYLFPRGMVTPVAFTLERFYKLTTIVDANNIRHFSTRFLRCLPSAQLNALPWVFICEHPTFLNHIFRIDEEVYKARSKNMLKGLSEKNFNIIKDHLDPEICKLRG